MAYGAAGSGVDGVGVAHAVFLIILTVVAGGDDGAVLQCDGGFEGAVVIFVRCGLFDSHHPWGAVGLVTTGHHFATHVDEVVGDAHFVEHVGQEVYGIALSDGVKVELDALGEAEACSTVATEEAAALTDEGEQAVELSVGDILPVFEAEPIQVHQSAYFAVEGPFGVFFHLE